MTNVPPLSSNRSRPQFPKLVNTGSNPVGGIMSTRREFLQSAGALGAVAVLPLTLTTRIVALGYDEQMQPSRACSRRGGS